MIASQRERDRVNLHILLHFDATGKTSSSMLDNEFLSGYDLQTLKGLLQSLVSTGDVWQRGNTLAAVYVTTPRGLERLEALRGEVYSRREQVAV